MIPSFHHVCRHVARCSRSSQSLLLHRSVKPCSVLATKVSFHKTCRLHQHQEHSESSTVSPDEVLKFSRMAGEWWNETGEVRPLHALNELRVPLVLRGLEAAGAAVERSARPLRGLSILDVGCGGGLLSEPLARLGADVTGIDAADDNVQVAKVHAASDIRLRGPGLRRPVYRCSTVEELADAAPAAFDAVVASEVLEHVENQKLFVDCCCRLLKPGGSLFFTTLNRSTRAWLLAVVAAERLLRLLPNGTHDWNKFIRPDELHALIADNGLALVLQHGMRYNPVTCRWSWTADTSVSYALHAVAPPA